MQLKSIIYTLVQSYGYIIIIIYICTLSPPEPSTLYLKTIFPKTPRTLHRLYRALAIAGHFVTNGRSRTSNQSSQRRFWRNFQRRFCSLKNESVYATPQKSVGKKTGKNRVSSWWFFPTHLKNISQIGNHPQFSG